MNNHGDYFEHLRNKIKLEYSVLGFFSPEELLFRSDVSINRKRSFLILYECFFVSEKYKGSFKWMRHAY